VNSDANAGETEGMARRDRIIITGRFLFPHGMAASRTLLGLGKALRLAGYNVSYLANEGVRQPDGDPVHEGFRYDVAAGNRRPTAGLRTRLVHWIRSGEILARNFPIQAPPQSLAAVIAYVPYYFEARGLLRYCTEHAIPLVVCCCEWQPARYAPLGFLGPRYWEQEACMRRLYRRIGHVLTWTTYLERHFLRQQCHVLTVPPLIDPEDPEAAAVRANFQPRADVLRLNFAGIPTRDRLDLILRGLTALRREGLPVVMTCLGFSRETLVRCAGAALVDGAEREGGLVCLGRVDQADVAARLAAADFGLLLRKRERWSAACFPSRVTEYLSLGVPMLCNVTSDLGSYLRDGREALVVEEVSEKAFVAAVRRAWSLSHQARASMRQAAWRRARESFSYRRYAGPLGRFMAELHGPPAAGERTL
jgi:glycosyltransferase involved in cell wall biosynthesis